MRRAGAGHVPPADGTLEIMPSPPGRAGAVLTFTACHIVAADVEPGWVRSQLQPDDFIAPMGPRFLFHRLPHT